MLVVGFWSEIHLLINDFPSQLIPPLLHRLIQPLAIKQLLPKMLHGFILRIELRFLVHVLGELVFSRFAVMRPFIWIISLVKILC